MTSEAQLRAIKKYDRVNIEKEKSISGKNASIVLEVVAEYKGKIFWDYFGSFTQKEHCYLFGFESRSKILRPVRFCGDRFEDITPEEFKMYVEKGIIQGGMIPKLENSFSAIDAGVSQVIISPDSQHFPAISTIKFFSFSALFTMSTAYFA